MNESDMNVRQPGFPIAPPPEPEIVVVPRTMPDMKKPAGDGMPLAIALVPMQKWEGLYDADVAFQRGTLFQALDLPFLGSEAAAHG